MADRVILKRFEFPHEAELCASFLRNQGIQATVDDALLVGPNPLMNIAYGGVKVRIYDNEVERATEILAELDDVSRESNSTSPPPPMSSDERTIRRAHATALVGLVLAPGILHLYSLYLILSVRNTDLSDKGKRLRNFALVLSTLMVGVATWVGITIVTR